VLFESHVAGLFTSNFMLLIVICLIIDWLPKVGVSETEKTTGFTKLWPLGIENLYSYRGCRGLGVAVVVFGKVSV